MKTIILPGGSIKNKAWAEEMASAMSLSDFKIIEWEAWASPEPTSLNFQTESEKLIRTVEAEKVNILAKSIGTIVFSKNIPGLSNQINKVVLCGLPLDGEGFTDENFGWYSNLKLLPPASILVIQNINDPLGQFSKISDYVRQINPDIKVISKDRTDHNYPYPEDFRNFLSD